MDTDVGRVRGHTCTHCGKRLTRRTARLVDGVVMCSTCMFKPASQHGGTPDA